MPKVGCTSSPHFWRSVEKCGARHSYSISLAWFWQKSRVMLPVASNGSMRRTSSILSRMRSRRRRFPASQKCSNRVTTAGEKSVLPAGTCWECRCRRRACLTTCGEMPGCRLLETSEDRAESVLFCVRMPASQAHTLNFDLFDKASHLPACLSVRAPCAQGRSFFPLTTPVDRRVTCSFRCSWRISSWFEKLPCSWAASSKATRTYRPRSCSVFYVLIKLFAKSTFTQYLFSIIFWYFIFFYFVKSFIYFVLKFFMVVSIFLPCFTFNLNI